LYTGWIVVVHLCCGFSLWRQMAPQQSAKFITAFWGQFRTSLRNDNVVNYDSIWRIFPKSVTRPDVLEPQESENCGRNFAKCKQSDAEFAGNRLLRMVIIL